MKTVGIIGGFGPETTSEFYINVFFSCQKKNDKVKPGIIISSVPLPYQIETDLIVSNKDSERYIPFLITEAKRLEKAGADFIVMPCNSLHTFIEEIRASVKVPVLSIIEETVKYLKKNKCKTAGIISTSTTIQNRLYETAFEKSKINYEIPNDSQQKQMGQFILNLVRGQQKKGDREELIKIINNFEKKGVDCVALACTDLQLLTPRHPRLKIIDTMKILVDATVKEILK
jgi:aspartate racemase